MAKPGKPPRAKIMQPTVSAGEEPVEDLDEAEEEIPFTYAITSYGADYPVDSIVKSLTRKLLNRMNRL